jgi:hypothetical protein
MNKLVGYGLIGAVVILCACLSRQNIKISESDNLKKAQITFSGGTGDSYETAIIIKGNQYNRKPETAVEAEYEYISGLYGKKGKEWIVEEQSIVQENTKVFDMVRVKILLNGKMHFFYFDITFFSKKSAMRKSDDNL